MRAAGRLRDYYQHLAALAEALICNEIRAAPGREVLSFVPGEVPHRPPENLGWRGDSVASPY
jgi:hypothetical protein